MTTVGAEMPTEITEREKEFPRQLSTSAAGGLILVLRQTENWLLVMLGTRCATQPLTSPLQRAICGFGAQAFNLLRSADLLITSGYPVQSLVFARSLYEIVVTAAHFRSNPNKVERWLAKKTDVWPNFAGESYKEMQALLDAYVSVRNLPAFQQSVFDELKATLPKLYGYLSRYSHPGYDPIELQFRVDDGGRLTYLTYGPVLDNLAVPVSAVAVVTIVTFQFFLETLFLLEFRHDNQMPWETLAETWEKYVFSRAQQFKPVIDSLKSQLAEIEAR